MTDKHYAICIKDEKGNRKRSMTIWHKDIESIGGIGNFIESIDHTLRDNESIVISVFFR
jgi:hypothetical protein